MAYEVFVRSRQRQSRNHGEMYVRVSSHRVFLSKAICDTAKLPSTVIFMVDNEGKMLAIKGAEIEDKNAYRLYVKHDQTTSLYAASLIDALGLSSQRYPATFEDGMIQFSFAAKQ